MKILLFTFFLDFFVCSHQHDSLSEYSAINKSLACSAIHSFVKEIYLPVFLGPGIIPVKLKIQNFKSFDELNFKCFIKSRTIFKSIELHPSKSLLLDNKWNLKINEHLLQRATLEIYLINFKGIDVNSNLFSDLKSEFIVLDFHFSIIEFYTNGLNIFACEKNLLSNSSLFNFFNKINKLTFAITVKYKPNICPLIFKDKSMQEIKFFGISNSFVKMNILSFKDLALGPSESFNFSIQNLYLTVYNLELNQKLLNKDLFLTLNYLVLRGTITRIEPELFSWFRNLTTLALELDHFGELMAKSPEWLKDIASLPVENNFVLEFGVYYTFPDEDICLFRHFPINLAISLVFTAQNCTCTLFMLMKNNSNSICLNSNLIYKCNNDENIKNCNKSLYLTVQTRITRLDYWYLSEIFDYLSIYLTPIFCVIGFLNNLLNIKVLLNQNQKEEIKKEMKKILYKLMLFNSILNSIYCFFYFFHLANICVAFGGIFCSSMGKTVWDQYYELYIIEYFNNIIKTYSNILCVLISFNRYILLDKNSYWSRKAEHLSPSSRKIKVTLAILGFLFLVLFNLNRILSSTVNRFYLSIDYYDYVEFPLKNTFSSVNKVDLENSILPSSLLYKKNGTFFILFLINFFLNDIVLFLLLFVCDLFLLIKFKKDLSVKRRFYNKENSSNDYRIKKVENVHMRITLTVCFNSFVLILFRFLELGTSVFVFTQRLNGDLCRYINKICSNLIQLGDLFYLISCSYSTIIFYYLNIHFRQSFDSYFDLNLKLKIVDLFNTNFSWFFKIIKKKLCFLNQN